VHHEIESKWDNTLTLKHKNELTNNLMHFGIEFHKEKRGI
jgi:hypothetical protein